MGSSPRTPRLSISTRLTLWYGLTLALLLSLFAGFCYASFHRGLHRDFDAHLDHETRALRPFVALDAGGPRFPDDERVQSVAIRTGGVYGTYVRLFDAAGRERYRSPNFAGEPSLPVRLPAGSARAPVSRTWGGRPARSAYARLVADGRPAGWMEVTGFEWSLHQELERLGRALAAGTLVSLLLALGGGGVLARRALRPVAVLTDSAARIGERDLSARLAAPSGVRDELTDLAETFNGMLARLEASVARERRFTANAAHELMTPITTLLSEAEVALRRDRTPEAYRAALAGVVEVAREMGAKVDGLLALARTDRPGALPAERVEVGALVQRHAARFAERASERGLRLDVDAGSGATILATPAAVGQIVDNLVDNAVKYTPAGGTVRVRVALEAGAVVLAVHDTGVGFEPEAAERLFDRFYRADAHAVQAERGSGLGLTIVRALARSTGGDVRASSGGAGQGARFEVRWPAAHDA